MDECKEMKDVRDAVKKGPAAVRSYIQEHMDKWKSEEVQLCVTGRTATAKSTFINTIRHVRPGDESYAKVGSGCTTTKPSRYCDQKNSKIVYVDLPGYGTFEFPTPQYLKKMKVQQYDFIFIFVDRILGEDDLLLAEELVEARKRFCFVYSKIDIDLEMAKWDDKDTAQVIPEIQKRIEMELEKIKKLQKNKAVFLISNRYQRIGQWNELFEFVSTNISSFKHDATLSTLPIITKSVLDRKYEMLRKRIKKATAIAVIVGAAPVGGVDLVNFTRLEMEITHCMDVFGLSKPQIPSLYGIDKAKLRCLDIFIGHDMQTFLIGKLPSTFALIAPVIGSIITASKAGIMVHKVLNGMLSDLKQDALFIYKLGSE